MNVIVASRESLVCLDMYGKTFAIVDVRQRALE
jgi:hypothetical protein